MAYVSQTGRDTNTIRNTVKIGPGHYDLQMKKEEIAHSSAPFYSTTIRSKVQREDNQPGPGQYTIQTSMVHPAVTTYTNNSSIIIKVNSAGTQPFMSKKNRFLDDINGIPGPGQYILSPPRKPQKSQKINKRPKKIVSNQKTAPSIFSKLLSVNQKSDQSQQNKNDRISVKDFKQSTRGVLVGAWGKDKVKRFGKRCYSQVGPGKYNLESKKKVQKIANPAVGFSSKTVRSMFDTLVYNTLNNQILQFRLANNYKDQRPAPGTYDSNQQQPNIESMRYKNHTFGSNNPRFAQANSQIQSRKIPYYDVSRSFKSQSFNKKKVPFNTDTKRSISIETKNQSIPGPGYYNGDKIHKTSILTSSIQCFGTLVKRPILEPPTFEKIGPGYYEPQKSKMTTAKSNSIFKSTIPRQFQQNKPMDRKFGEYDVSGQDISRRVLELRINRNNLKLINCQIPPFEKKSPRFSHYQQKKQEGNKLTVKQRLNLMYQIKQEVRQRQINLSRQQINDKKGCSIGRGGQRFKNQIKGPGVGHYCLRSNWVKKSYNLKYKIQNDQ